jgi:hypothetical protein
VARKTIARNAGESGRINASGDELRQLGVEIGDAVDVEIAESTDIAHAIIDSKDTDRFLIVTPAQ